MRRFPFSNFRRCGILCVAAFTLMSSSVQAQPSKTAFPVRYVPQNTLVAVGVRPAQLLAAESLQVFQPQAKESGLLNPLHGVPIENVERLLISLAIIDPTIGRFQTAFVLQTKEPIDQDDVIKTVIPQNRVVVHGGQRYRKDTDSQFRAVSVWFPDENTLIVTEGDQAMETVIDSAAKAEPAWQAAVKPDASLILYENVARAQELIEMGMNVVRQFARQPQLRGRIGRLDPSLIVLEPILGMFAPLWQDVDTMVWNFNAGDSIQLEAVANVEKNGSLEEVEETLRAVRVLKRNSFSYLTETDRPSEEPAWQAYSSFLQMADEMMKTTKITRDDRSIRITATLPTEKLNQTIATLVPTMLEIGVQQRRARSKNNMKQLGIAMHIYHDRHRQLPPPVIMGPDGKTPVSWRVAILPYVAANDLHKRYNFNEPWDSEDNKKLLKEMPDVYRHPEDDADSTNTSYFAIVGEKTGLGPKGGDGIRFQDVTDGLSNTLLIVETKKNVPWTKPDDIAYDPKGKKLPEFGGWYKDGYHVLFGDGSVQMAPKSIEDDTLRKLIERDDGQVVEFPR